MMMMMRCGNGASGVLFMPSCFCSCWKWKLYPPPPTTKRNRRRSVKVFCQKRENVNSSYDFDPELRSALELATDSELCEIQTILFGPSQESGNHTPLLDVSTQSDAQGTLQLGLNQWKMHSKVGTQDFQSLLFKGGGILTLAKIYQLLAGKLSGKMLGEAANYQVKKELLKKGGQFALINLESRTALLAAKKGFIGAASRYLGFRSMLTLLGPVLWGTFLADLVIQMLGTDYARILRTIYALAQIRVIRTYKLPSDIAEE
ncbi:uncharacterized protein LOC127107991 isoform X5 [Lathyrus oleraceus]|uniref:uncharacterized protein LOC127107991 isoform X5 n=1 Tax=Pisum sativum TaxID=3888 RepID=UPI0021D22D58|nr:uncharacterized protein LOC127107991 isoform X5 [Pisum sativum]